ARLAQGTVRGPQEAAERGRQLDQQGRQDVRRGRPQPRHRLRAVKPVLLQEVTNRASPREHRLPGGYSPDARRMPFMKQSLVSLALVLGLPPNMEASQLPL